MTKALLNGILKNSHVEWPKRGPLNTLQVNVGSLCNMTCKHCHVNAGPTSKEVMSEETAEEIIGFLSKENIKTLDLTGGAPEMAPPFRYLVSSASDLVDEIIVRCNLTILFEKGMEYLPAFYKETGARLVCSLPCYTKENVDAQRGEDTFDKSIKALKILNETGYGRGNCLKLDLVYNPGGAFLPGNQESLEDDYRKVLSEEYGINFDNLITITNMPINRFASSLKEGDGTEGYLKLLAKAFNPMALENIMCRDLISVGWDGTLYDCDFNQALKMSMPNSDGHPMTIDSFDTASIPGNDIFYDDHCLGCVAGEGSSCSGALI